MLEDSKYVGPPSTVRLLVLICENVHEARRRQSRLHRGHLETTPWVDHSTRSSALGRTEGPLRHGLSF